MMETGRLLADLPALQIDHLADRVVSTAIGDAVDGHGLVNGDFGEVAFQEVFGIGVQRGAEGGEVAGTGAFGGLLNLDASIAGDVLRDRYRVKF